MIFFQNIISKIKTNRSIAISIIALATSGLFATAITTIGGIIQARYINPETLGYFSQFSILPGYLMFLHLGIFVSLNREYPYYVGKGDNEKALEIVRNSLGWVYVCQSIFCLIIGSLITQSLFIGDYKAAITWCVQLIIGLLNFYLAYLGYTYRTSRAFVDWSKSLSISAIASFILLPLIMYFNYWGLCLRSIITNGVNAIYLHRFRPVRVKPELNINVINRMIKFGLPMAVLGYIGFELFILIQKNSILIFCGVKTLGLYTFAIPITAAINQVSNSFLHVFNPKITMLYGSTHNDLNICYKYSLKCILIAVFFMLLVISGASLIIKPFVTFAAPKYIAGIPLIKVFIWTTIIPALEIPVQLLIISKNIASYAICTITGFLASIVILLITPNENRTANFIIIAFMIGKLINVILTQFAIIYQIRKECKV